MDEEISANGDDSNPSNKAKEISSFEKEVVNVNGINGFSPDKHKSHKSEHKDKHRDKDRDRSKDHKSSSKDKDRHSSSSKDKDRHSSHKSSSKDKERSEKDRDKDRSDRDKNRSDKDRSDRDKDRGDRDKDRSDRDKHRDKDRDKDKHRDEKKSSSSKDKDREHKSSRDKEHKSSSSSKDKEGRDKDKKDRDKDRDKDKERHKDKDKERDKDKDKHRHSSSKDKERDRHSSSKDKHRDKDKEKHSSSKDKDRKDKEKKSDKDREEEKKPVEEPIVNKYDSSLRGEDSVSEEDDDKLVIKEETTDSQEDEPENINLSQVSQASSCDYSLSQFKGQLKEEDEFEEEEQEESQLEDDETRQGYNDGRKSIKQEDVKDFKDFKPPLVKEEESDEDMPLAARVDKSNISVKRKIESDDEDDMPLVARKKPKKEKKEKKKKRHDSDYEDEEEDYKPVKKKEKKDKDKKKIKVKEEIKTEIILSPTKKGKKKKEEDEPEVWKWWEEQKKDDGTKWNFLEHKGPVFAPPYERLPENVKFFYDGKELRLSEAAEEIAGFYAKMLEHDYTSKPAFNKNFFDDWRKSMTEKERSLITDLKKCNFRPMHKYFMDLSEKNKNRTKEEKLALKEKNEALLKEYGFCKIDGHKEKIGNFKIEPPGLFRGRGEHPKMGKLKKRVEAEDIIINCSKDSDIPQPPPGHKWKEVRHDGTVTWLASWTENVQNQVKYIMLNPSSKLKGEKDWQKYETARKLHACINKIRGEYKDGWKSKEMKVRQRAVALYFIDRLALRAGNEKDEDQADTVGCCSLRVEHIELHEEKDGKEFVVVFDFLGKDSIRYYNEVPVEKRVFKNLQLFMENKKAKDELFDRLTTQIMNKHLNDLMEGLTAKVFRTYNASWTLQQQLNELTNADDSIAEKILSYNRANRAVAILCNHQRSVPKGHEKSMEKLKEKIDTKREQIKDAERQVKDAARDAKHGSVREKTIHDKKKKMLQRMKEQLTKLEIQETDRDENKTIALGTSKLNYLDPRISVAWCKKYDVPIEKIYNKTQRDKFRWAIDMAGPDYQF